MGDLGGREGGREGGEGERKREREKKKGGERREEGKARMIHLHSQKNTILATTHPPPPGCRRTEVVRAAVEGADQPPSFAVPASSISFSFCAGGGKHKERELYSLLFKSPSSLWSVVALVENYDKVKMDFSSSSLYPLLLSPLLSPPLLSPPFQLACPA